MRFSRCGPIGIIGALVVGKPALPTGPTRGLDCAITSERLEDFDWLATRVRRRSTGSIVSSCIIAVRCAELPGCNEIVRSSCSVRCCIKQRALPSSARSGGVATSCLPPGGSVLMGSTTRFSAAVGSRAGLCTGAARLSKTIVAQSNRHEGRWGPPSRVGLQPLPQATWADARQLDVGWEAIGTRGVASNSANQTRINCITNWVPPKVRAV